MARLYHGLRIGSGPLSVGGLLRRPLDRGGLLALWRLTLQPLGEFEVTRVLALGK
jgi:hypothetical protein